MKIVPHTFYPKLSHNIFTANVFKIEIDRFSLTLNTHILIANSSCSLSNFKHRLRASLMNQVSPLTSATVLPYFCTHTHTPHSCMHTRTHTYTLKHIQHNTTEFSFIKTPSPDERKNIVSKLQQKNFGIFLFFC